MSRKNKKKALKKIQKASAAIRGTERKQHFDNGGTLTQWRGLHQTHTSRSEKRRSRNSDQQNAISDSNDS